jgi:menaquinone-dependent protoporphyrinogen oxidase
MSHEPNNKRVLVTWGSKHGGTEGIGRIVAEALAERGFDVVSGPARDVRTLEGFDAVIVGGAVYAFRWTPEARRFVQRHAAALRRVPVWFFSSGPLDDSAERAELPPPTEVAVLAERVGARAHVTFGGRLERDVKGFPAAAMAKEHAATGATPIASRSGRAGSPRRFRRRSPARRSIIPRARSIACSRTRSSAGRRARR